MNNFTYTPAATTKEVRGLRQERVGSTYIAGGTTLLDMMKANLVEYAHLLDLNALPFTGIEQTPDGLRLGALERMSDAGENALVMQQFPAVSRK